MPDSDEVCDGDDLTGEDCLSLGYDDGDAAGQTGAIVATGNADAEDDTLSISCAMGGGADQIVSFTAPSAGQRVFETVDSDCDTALAAFDTCDVTSELACNDDAAGQQSQITLNLEAGQTILLVVEPSPCWKCTSSVDMLSVASQKVQLSYDRTVSPEGPA